MNTLGNLNASLHEQLERLNEIDVNSENLEKEIARSKAVGDISKSIVSNAALVLENRKFMDDRTDIDKESPKMLEG